MKLYYTKDKSGILNEKKTFKGYHDSGRLFETYKYLKTKDFESTNGELPPPCKKSYAYGITIDIKETIKKDFISNLNELKRLSPD